MEERHFFAALAEWDKARNAARKRGGIMPAVNEVPIDVYRTAIEGAKKKPAASSLNTEVPEGASVGDDEIEELLDEPEGEPSPTPKPLGREYVLRLLSDVVRAAIAAQDIVAADIANDAISRLCQERQAS